MTISSFLVWISSFSVMREMSSLGVFFGKRSPLLFWQKGKFIFVRKRNTTFTNIQKTSYFHAFFDNIFHFPSVKKNHIFWKKKYHLSSWYKKGHIPVQLFRKTIFSEIWRIYHISIYFLRKITFHFPPKE